MWKQRCVPAGFVIYLKYRFSAVFSYMLWYTVPEFCISLCYNVQCTTNQVRVSTICFNFCRSYAPFGTYYTWKTQFSALFSYMLCHIKLKLCICLCYALLQIKLECRQFASMFVGVMPILELNILEIHSFPHFSSMCFDKILEIQFSTLLSYMLRHIQLNCIWLSFYEEKVIVIPWGHVWRSYLPFGCWVLHNVLWHALRLSLSF